MATRETDKQVKWHAAAERVALDIETDDAIARSVGVKRWTLHRWKTDPEFQAMVDAARERQQAAVIAQGVADKVNRIARLDDTRRKLLRVIAERAADPSMADVPGGETGLLVRQTKFVKVYEVMRPEKKRPTNVTEEPDADDETGVIVPSKRVVQVEEFAVDTGTLSELRAIEMQAAKELGQITDKHEHSGRLRVASDDMSGLTVEELEAIERIYAEADARIAGAGQAGTGNP